MSAAAGPGIGFDIAAGPVRGLPTDADLLKAIVDVSLGPGSVAGRGPRIAEILIMDRSLSMMRESKIREAQRAACAAIDALPNEALLSVVAGDSAAEKVFPLSGGFAAMDNEGRERAKRRVRQLRPNGGTRIGQWLTVARETFTAEPGGDIVRHAILYTDGKNEHESAEELHGALSECGDQFTCDVRGVGGDWDHEELERVADVLHGDATAVLDIEDLTGDFTRLIERVRRLAVPRAFLRLGPRGSFRIEDLHQTYPRQVDCLPGRHVPGGETADIGLGAWESREIRSFMITLRFDPATVPIGEDRRALRLDLLTEAADGTRISRADAAVIVRRHSMPDFEPEQDGRLTQTEKEFELTSVIRSCTRAWFGGRFADANAELDKAMELARDIGDGRLAELEQIACPGPNDTFRVCIDRLPENEEERSEYEEMRAKMKRLGLHSTKTSRTNATDPVRRRCPRCKVPQVEGSVYCEACGLELGKDGAS